MKKLTPLLLLLLIISACTVEPSKIAYGHDACGFCKMTIVDQQHAAQLVTKKGKAFKYDAIECMLNEMIALDQTDIALFLVTDYLDPASLIDASSATFLISPEIKSPMGANLSAFATKDAAARFVKTTESKLHTWTEIQQQSFK